MNDVEISLPCILHLTLGSSRQTNLLLAHWYYKVQLILACH